MVTYIVTGTATVVRDMRDNYVGTHTVVDIDVSDLPNPTQDFGYVEGTDPRVFPAMVELDPGVIETVTEIASTVLHVVADHADEDVFVFISDSDGGDVIAPAVGTVVDGFLRHKGCETDVSHTGVMELI